MVAVEIGVERAAIVMTGEARAAAIVMIGATLDHVVNVPLTGRHRRITSRRRRITLRRRRISFRRNRAAVDTGTIIGRARHRRPTARRRRPLRHTPRIIHTHLASTRHGRRRLTAFRHRHLPVRRLARRAGP